MGGFFFGFFLGGGVKAVPIIAERLILLDPGKTLASNSHAKK